MKDYKETLLMPKTDFDMKANLIEKEPKFREFWKDNNIYQKALEKNKNNKRFILHDGPPYANGSLHVGHAMNKILKDIIVRYKTMRGFYTPFIPGWDTHGLPIENKMLEELGMKKDDLDPIELREEAAKYALSQVEIQKEQFFKMQLFSTFEDKYLTLNKKFEVGQLKLFKKMVMNGLIYKGLKPVYWSTSSQSALAEAEVEYKDIRSPQIIVAFDIVNSNSVISKNDKLLIMTTTPWTLIANSGVAVGKEIEYVLLNTEKGRYIIAKNLVDSVKELIKVDKAEIISQFRGKEILGIKYSQPISKVISPVVLGHHVNTEAGTGLVHIAPLFGEDDYIIGKENELKQIMHVNDDGSLNKMADEYEGQYYEDASKDIGLRLEKEGKLLSLKFIKHSYPHDWRTHKPIIFRGTPQWFVSIDKIKKEIIDELEKVDSYPKWGKDRISKMIKDRYDWTISRQRTWGVPIIIFYDQEGNIVVDSNVFDYVINLVKEYGTDVWWKRETDELLPEEHRGKKWTREMDIMDVWFDSGSSSIAMEEMYPEILGNAPYDLYLEGSDQYRGWFNSSLINSVAYRGKSPYKKLISHGFVLDGKMQKMSKSKGNVINPLDIISKRGADILRLWVANSEYTSDVSISDDILKQTSNLYRNFRTKIRFMLGNLSDFEEKDKVELTSYHKIIYSNHTKVISNVISLMDSFKIDKAIKELNEYIVKLSGWYLDVAKDSLYADSLNENNRRQYQTNIYMILKDILLVLAPIIPSTAEEAYQKMKMKNKHKSIFLEQIISNTFDTNETLNNFFSLKDKVYKAIEVAKKDEVIKRSNEALITIDVDTEYSIEQLRDMFMVAEVRKGNEIKVENPHWNKCIRCWNHFEKLNNDICNRCEKVLKK